MRHHRLPQVTGHYKKTAPAGASTPAKGQTDHQREWRTIMIKSSISARAAAIAQRDQILAILAAASSPMSAKEISAEMPPYWSIHYDTLDQCDHDDLRLPHWRRFEHVNGRCFLLMDFPTCVLGVRLAALRKAGLISREGVGNAARWSFSGALTDLSDLESQFA